MTNIANKNLYRNQKLYLGIDVHKRTYSVAVVHDGEIVKKWRTAANPKAFVKQLQQYFPQAILFSAYEAGFSAFVLHRELEQAGITNLVVNASSIEVSSHNRVKTDKRDAVKIASLLSVGRLKGIRIPEEQEEAHRLLTRTRKQLVEERTSVKNKIRMKCHQFGLISPEDHRSMSHIWMEALVHSSPSQEFRLVLEAYWQVWKTIEAQLKKLEQALAEQASNDPNEKIYRSAPGIGPLGARVLSNEMGDLSQFKNERQLFSYTGLTPSEHSSGDNVRKGHITRQGNSRVRHILCQAAWRAIREDQGLMDFYKQLYPRRGKKRAIVAVARKLIGRIRAAFRKNVIYQIESVS